MRALREKNLKNIREKAPPCGRDKTGGGQNWKR